MSLSKHEKAAQAPMEVKWNSRKMWWEFTIRDAIWHVQDTWKEVTQSCVCGVWKKLYLQFAVNFKGFDLTEKLSEERSSASSWRRRLVSVGGGGEGSATAHGAIDGEASDSEEPAALLCEAERCHGLPGGDQP